MNRLKISSLVTLQLKRGFMWNSISVSIGIPK